MKKTLLSALVSTALLIGFASAASAETLSAPVNITATVMGTCTWMPPADINIDIGDGVTQVGSVGSAGGPFFIKCNLDMPYTITTDAGEGGAITLIGQNTGKTMNGHVQYTDDIGGAGYLSTTEALTSVGTGFDQTMGFFVDLNGDKGGELPAIDVYTGTTTMYFNF